MFGQVVCTPSRLNCPPSPCDRLSLPRTTTGTPPAWWTSGSTPLAFHHAFPRSYAGLSRAGEVAGRSPCPCVPQVDADAMVWLRSPHDAPQTAYISACVRISPAWMSGGIVSIPPVKPCRRRRHFSPRMRINRFVFLNLPVLQPREPSRRNGFASSPFTCRLRHPAN